MDEILARLIGADPNRALLAMAAVLGRVGAAVWIAPFLGGRLVPTTVKISLALILALVLYPQVVGTVPAGVIPVVAVALVVKEVFVGLALGFVMATVFWAAEAAGRMADTARGANMAEVMVPQSGARTSPLGDLFFQLAVVLFIVLGGHRIFISALGASYLSLPVSYFPDAGGLGSFALLCGRVTADIFLIGLTLAAPVIAAVFLTDVTLGVINRFTPQINVFFLAMPVKAAIGIAVVVLAVGLLLGALPPLLDRATGLVGRALGLLSG